MSTIQLEAIKQRIAQAALTYHRPLAQIKLIGVSKGQPLSQIIAAHQAGLNDFAESYWQEAHEKIATLHALPITWHFIGPIQSNKAQAIAQHFDWIHSVDRKKIAALLSQYRPHDRLPLQVLIQVNLDQEISKAGVSVDDVVPLADYIDSLPHVTLRGLMAIPAARQDAESQYRSFLRLSELLLTLNIPHRKTPLDTLSMGMSGDYVPAIRAGSTMLRIGEALFGQRTPRNNKT